MMFTSMPFAFIRRYQIYSVLSRAVLILLMVAQIHSAPMPTTASSRTSVTAASSPSVSVVQLTEVPALFKTSSSSTITSSSSSPHQDADDFDMRLPTRPDYQRIPLHRSNDALRNLFESSRTTEETNKPAASSALSSSSWATTSTENIIHETETVGPREEREHHAPGSEYSNDHYFEAATTSQSFAGDDVGTTQYTEASSSLSSNTREVGARTKTHFIVKTTIPPPVSSPVQRAHPSIESSLEFPKVETDAIVPITKRVEQIEGVKDATQRAIDSEVGDAMKTANTIASSLSPATAEPSLLPSVSSQESETTIKFSNAEKNDLVSSEMILAGLATATVDQESQATTTTTTSGASVSPLRLTTPSATPAAITSVSSPPQTMIPTTRIPTPVATTTPGVAVVANNPQKYKNKLQKGMGAGKGASSITKKKSGITIMGHDGVKVTRKKQLLEKSFRDEVDTVQATTIAFPDTTVMEMIASATVAKSHQEMEPITTVVQDEVTSISTPIHIVPATLVQAVDSSILSSTEDATRATGAMESGQSVSTEKSSTESVQAGSAEMETENELWSRDDAKKNFFHWKTNPASTSGSTDATHDSSESGPINFTNDATTNLDESNTSQPSSASAVTYLDTSDFVTTTSSPRTVTQLVQITTEDTFSKTSTISSSSAPIATTTMQIVSGQNNSPTSDTLSSANFSISSSTTQVFDSSPSSTAETDASVSTVSSSSTSLPPKTDFLNETHILVVEITSADNSTVDDVVSNEDSAYNGNSIPKFTIHNDGISEYDSGNTRPYGTGVEIDYENSKSQADDDLFVPDLKLEPMEDMPPVTVSAKAKNPSAPRPQPARDSIDRDSDTIFYISNTEVKVVESKPTQNSNTANPDVNSNFDSRRPNPDAQYYPSIYEEDVIIDFPAKNVTFSVAPNQSGSVGKDDDVAGSKSDRYEEDIILSPLKNNFDPLKIIANRNNGDSEQKPYPDLSLGSGTINRHISPLSLENNPSLTYIGEKLIEVEPSQTDSPITFPDQNPNNSETPLEVNESLVPISDVIIQPAIIPEMSIGVPVIGELPPQIELREIDFLADSPMLGGSGGGGSSGASNGLNNGVNDPNTEKFDGIQYGGDLFSRDASVLSGGAGYDMDTEYVFGGRRGGHSTYAEQSAFNSPNNPITVNRHKYDGRDNNGHDGRYDGNNDVTFSSKIFMHAADNLQKDQLVAEVRSGFKELPSARHSVNTNGTGVGTAENLTNATAYSVMEDADGDFFNFTDIQTLFLACFATLVPLILCVLLAFGLRYLWRKYRPGPSVGGLMGDTSTDPLATKSMTMSQDELKSTESGYAINRSNDTLDSNDTENETKTDDRTRLAYCNAIVSETTGHDLTPNGMITSSSNASNHTGANGSVITMTLKNNHLIVETEERNDISRDARETKMHYTPSEKDGVFVVEVARGADSAGVPASPRNNAETRPLNHTIDIENSEKVCRNDANTTNHEEVQIHQPPRDGATTNDVNTIVEVDSKDNDNLTSLKVDLEPLNTNLSNSNTGLSQSDLSTSSGDSNKGYTYGNQQLYTIETKGYRPPSPKLENVGPKLSPMKSDNEEPDATNERRAHPETKPIITAALLKQDTVNEITDNGSVQGYKPNGNNESSQKNGIETVDMSNGHITNTFAVRPSSPASASPDRKDAPGKDLSYNNSNDDVSHDDQHHQIENGKITPVTDNNNGHNNATEPPVAFSMTTTTTTAPTPMVAPPTGKNILENGTQNGGQENGTVDICDSNNGDMDDPNDMENGFDSIISLPPPPPTSDEIKQLNDAILMENSQLDSLPPPPPPVDSQSQILSLDTVTANGHATIEGQNGVAVPVAITGTS